MLGKISLYIQSLFYMIAGINHFINPGFYLPLIPDYLPEKSIINIFAGLAEILLAMALLSSRLRTVAIYGIILMLVAFIPSHIYFIEIGNCVDNGLCVSPMIAWTRLLLIHPLLIWWSLSARSISSPVK